jgi:hypothetical protein
MEALEAGEALTVIQNFGTVFEHIAHCSEIMPYTNGLVTVGFVWFLGKKLFLCSAIIFSSKVLYSLKKMWEKGRGV